MLFLTHQLNRSKFYMFASKNCASRSSKVIRHVSAFSVRRWAARLCFSFLRESCLGYRFESSYCRLHNSPVADGLVSEWLKLVPTLVHTQTDPTMLSIWHRGVAMRRISLRTTASTCQKYFSAQKVLTPLPVYQSKLTLLQNSGRAESSLAYLQFTDISS